MIELRIDCNPVPWKAHGGYGRKSFNPRYAEKEYYQWQIKRQYASNNPIEGAVGILYHFYMPIPESASKKRKLEMMDSAIFHITRPDTSNLLKFAEDTLKGLVIKDDSQVVELTAYKKYAEHPRTEIKIFLL